MTLCDTNVIVSLADEADPIASEYRKLADSISGPLVTTWPCITESIHIIGERAKYKGDRWHKQKIVAKMLHLRFMTIYEVSQTDYFRLFSLMEEYRDRPMDLADASLVYTAEETGDSRILTTDLDFQFYRINGRGSFEIPLSHLMVSKRRK